MSNKHIEELLQHCIAAFDAGLSPEECLSAFPAARDELEPLFRQAISLRVAFAASPSAEFRQRTRERLLFAAGRDVVAAFDANPDPEFVNDSRQRFIRAAGAEAQEALRAVPPPRLPFWMNTRRRLLEAAQAVPQPAPAPRAMGGVFALRAGLAMSVAVLALALAGLGYIAVIDQTPSANAQLAQLERDVYELELLNQQGSPLNAAAVQDVTARVNYLIGQLNSDQASPAVAQKLPELISRQRDVVLAATTQGSITPDLALAQQQQLALAAAKAEELRLAAAKIEDSTATPQPATSTPAPNQTPAATATARPPTAGEALTAGQLRVSDVAADTSRQKIELANMSFAIPDAWTHGVTLDSQGFGTFEGSTLIITTTDGSRLLVDATTGRITVFTPENLLLLVLRTGGVQGQLISQDELVAKSGGLVGDLRYIRDTFTPAGALIPTPTPTPSPTATPSATPTPPPPATSTATPSVTPTASATP